jgi:hypothetical protein
MTMDYKLAKELKDAGFPQGGNGTWVYPLTALMIRSSDRVYAPTLEELIEALGDRMYSLVRHKNGFFKAFSTDDAENMMDVSQGDNPTEAVARLWLALYKPNMTSEASS